MGGVDEMEIVAYLYWRDRRGFGVATCEVCHRNQVMEKVVHKQWSMLKGNKTFEMTSGMQLTASRSHAITH